MDGQKWYPVHNVKITRYVGVLVSDSVSVKMCVWSPCVLRFSRGKNCVGGMLIHLSSILLKKVNLNSAPPDSEWLPYKISMIKK